MNIQDLRDKNLIVMEAIVGSQAYGIATPTSDVDIKGVFIQPLEDILRIGYIDQVSDEKNDTTFYEIGRFLQLLHTNNPNILELLNVPEDCIIYKDPIFDKILDKSDQFITKICKMSFGGYAVQQIKKARGMNKKIVKPFEVKRQSVLDFCYVIVGSKSVPLKEHLNEHGLKQEFCGLVALDHVRYCYSVFYDNVADLKERGVNITAENYGYKGIVQDVENSNDISLSSIPKDSARIQFTPSFSMYFNKDGYSTYCREYKEYWDWVANRNNARYTDNMSHGGGFDGKNLAHCHRLLDMAIEIGEGKGINVRRQNREQLLDIRKGVYEYDILVKEAEDKIRKMDEVFEKSTLPEEVDIKIVQDLLLEIRKERYKI